MLADDPVAGALEAPALPAAIFKGANAAPASFSSGSKTNVVAPASILSNTVQRTALVIRVSATISSLVKGGHGDRAANIPVIDIFAQAMDAIE